jgi:CRISPR-associated endonuclease/helicase Cas3
VKLLAHTDESGAAEHLDAHSRAVGARARGFGAKFDAGDLGFAIGLLHDLGKAKPDVQSYLRGKGRSVPHAAEGARFATVHYGLKCPRPFSAPLGRLLTFAIAGHHAGLANGSAAGGGTLPLNERLAAGEEVMPWFELSELPALQQPPAPLKSARLDAFGWAFFARLLFSALVDADFLETEQWFAEVRNEPVPRGWTGCISDLGQAPG